MRRVRRCRPYPHQALGVTEGKGSEKHRMDYCIDGHGPPIPRVSDPIAVRANDRRRDSMRRPILASASRSSSHLQPQKSRLDSRT